eukprot:498125_1
MALNLFNNVLQENKHLKQSQLSLTVSKDHKKKDLIFTFFDEGNKYKITNMNVLGNAILKLSQHSDFDRIINFKVDKIHDDDFRCNPNLFHWMYPLLSDKFTSLIAFNENSGCGMCDHRVGFGHKQQFDIICSMLARDKLICVFLGFPFKQNLGIDMKLLSNAIKSTNTLKEIRISVVGMPQELEPILKEALALNFSVTSLIDVGNRGSTPFGTIVDDYELPHCFVNIYDDDSKVIKKRQQFREECNKTHNEYFKWWPIIKKRNEESQMFNRILVGTAKDDGTWNNSKCPYSIAQKLLKKQFPNIPSGCFDGKGDRCYCWCCHKKRKDKMIYKRGKPPKKYALPVEWVRFGLKTEVVKCLMNNVWDEWHVAFHGTTKNVIPQIFKAGLLLLKPGDYTITGHKLGIRANHIPKPYERFNKFTKQNETFDPNQIYVSPSIKYSGHGAYAKSFYCSHPDDKNRTLQAQFAFQLRIRPGCYKVGQETVGAARQGISLDNNFTNNEVEWYTKENIGILLHGLLIKIKEINVPLKKFKEKKKIIDVDDEKKEDK